MEPDRAIEIVQSLADGVDPYSGERFPSSSPYQQADIPTLGGGDALHLALEGLAKLRRSTACKVRLRGASAEQDGPGRLWREKEENDTLDTPGFGPEDIDYNCNGIIDPPASEQSGSQYDYANAAIYLSLRVDLDVDANHDGAIDDDDEGAEEDPGGYVCVNRDDDNGDGTPDMEETGTVLGEDDLEAIGLTVEPEGLGPGWVELEAVAGGSRIKVWETPAKGVDVALPKRWTPGREGIPPTLYVEGLEASSAPRDVELRLRYSSGTTVCEDTIRLSVLKVDTIDATSPVAGASPNPPPFEGHKPWPFDVTHSPSPDKHMVVFYKDVIDSSFNVQDFDVTLAANILPSSITADMLNEVWSRISGPSSGSFDRTDTFEVKYQNLKLGGVYRFDCDLGISGCAKSEANIVLPLAGAEIDSFVAADVGRANTFAATVVATYSVLERNLKLFHWFYNSGAGDYLGRPNNASTPTVWAYNQVNSAGFGVVATWKGKPVRLAKASNFLVAYGMRKLGITHTVAWLAQSAGTSNDLAAQKSWEAGWDVAGGASYDTTVSAMVADIFDDHDDPNQKNMKLWPNSSTADDYTVPGSFSDPDHEFTSPGFVYMTSP